MNHSCLPNLARVNWGKSVKVVTSRAVRKGEELCDNYGSSWGGGQGLRIIITITIIIGGQGFRERRKALAADYGFTCTCVACAAEEKEEVERFQEVESLIQADKKAPSKALSNESCERRSVDSLNDIWKEHKKNQEFAWKEGNLRIDNLRK